MSRRVTDLLPPTVVRSPDERKPLPPTDFEAAVQLPVQPRSAALKTKPVNPAQMSLFGLDDFASAAPPPLAHNSQAPTFEPVAAPVLLVTEIKPVGLTDTKLPNPVSTLQAVPDPVVPLTPLSVSPPVTPVFTPTLKVAPVTKPEVPITYTLKRAKRKSIGFMIDDAGLTVSAPRWVSRNEIEAAVAERAQWVRTKLEQWADRKRKLSLTRIQWVQGDELPFLGSTVYLSLHNPQFINQPTGIVGQYTLHVNVPPAASTAQIRDAVQSWLQAQAKRIFAERLEYFKERVHRPVTQWQLTSARSIWGRAHADGTVRLNWRLVHFGLDVIDYVVAHELAHLKEMNHSPRFWAEVGRLLPGFETARDKLRGVDPESLPLFND